MGRNMTNRNIIFIVFSLITMWFIYLTGLFSDQFLLHSNRHMFLTRYTPWLILGLLIAALVFMIRKSRIGTQLLLAAVLLQTVYEVVILRDMHFLMVFYIWAIYSLVPLCFDAPTATEQQS